MMVDTKNSITNNKTQIIHQNENEKLSNANKSIMKIAIYRICSVYILHYACFFPPRNPMKLIRFQFAYILPHEESLLELFGIYIV